jgi:NTP pyrophosphatase (non-canonical NTP hydrolase)
MCFSPIEFFVAVLPWIARIILFTAGSVGLYFVLQSAMSVWVLGHLSKLTVRKEQALDLVKFQTVHNVWRKVNFPYSRKVDPLLGLVEEVGELSHAVLKQRQGIRGTSDDHESAKRDAIGDIFIYLVDFCNREGVDIERCIVEAWGEVKNRNWVKYPKNGVDK